MNKLKRGVTLITLVITIIVMIILATAIVSVTINGKYIEKANYMKFSTSFENYKNELEDYIGTQEIVYNGRYNEKKLFADVNSVTYDGQIIEGMTIKDIISSISEEYINNVTIYEGEIIYNENN